MSVAQQPPETRIILAGGGGEQDSRPLDEQFAGWVGAGPLLYLPVALIHPPQMQAGVDWLNSVFAPLGVTDITAWNNLTGRTAREMERFAGVYIGGGNTFYLLQQLRLSGLARVLIDYARAGGPIYGGSAGAIVLGRDITPCAHIDEDMVGLRDLGGLSLVLGCAVWCHYTPGDDWRILEYVNREQAPVIALSERSGACRQGSQLFAAGYEPVRLFTPDDRAEFDPGQEIVLP